MAGLTPAAQREYRFGNSKKVMEIFVSLEIEGLKKGPNIQPMFIAAGSTRSSHSSEEWHLVFLRTNFYEGQESKNPKPILIYSSANQF